MKTIIIFLLSIILFGCNNKAEQKEELPPYNMAKAKALNGTVRSVVKITYEEAIEEFDEWKPVDSLNCYYFMTVYDEAGRIVHTAYRYNQKFLDDTTTYSTDYIYSVTDTGVLVQSTMHHNNTHYKDVYNKTNDNTWRIKLYNEEGEILREEQTVLDNNGYAEREETKMYRDGNTMDWVKYTFSYSNNMRDGYIIEDKMSEKTDSVKIKVLETDNHGNPLKTLSYENGTIDVLTTYEYSYYE